MKLNIATKMSMLCLINGLVTICYYVYIGDYRGISISLVCMILPVIILVYYKCKSNSKK